MVVLDVIVTLTELNKRNATREFMVVENRIGIPSGANSVCEPIMKQFNIDYIRELPDTPDQYKKPLSERTFDLDDIYIGNWFRLR